jgi:cbb3-type cytochrome oxidase maturation protein
MNIILLLIPLSFVLLAVGVWAFFWAVNHAQFDDLDTPALSPLADDEPAGARVEADTEDGTCDDRAA